MKVKNLLLMAIVCRGFFVMVDFAAAQSWQLSNVPTNVYSYAVASSLDGTRLAAAAYTDASGNHPGVIYTSADGGATWGLSGAPSNYWYAVASSTNGDKLAAVALGGGIYTSTNSGLTWTNTSAPSAPWDAIASSANGNTLVALAEGPNPFILVSTNGGTTWTNASAPTNEEWYAIAASADGTKLLAAANSQVDGSQGALFTSTNSGFSWVSNNLSGIYWNGVASSADGTKLAAVAPGVIYTSADSGNTWNLRDGPPGYWQAIASSADGSKLSVSTSALISTSTDSGATWTSDNAPALDWGALATSYDGDKLIAAAYGGGIYTLSSTPALNFTSSTNLTFQWPWPATGFSLQQNTNLASANWVTVTNLPVFTNWQNLVTLSRTNGNHFFRLKSP